MRYVAKRHLQCSQLLLLSGGLPNELVAEDFKFLNAKVSLVFGDDDEFINEERMKQEKYKIETLFGNNVNIITFEGKHEVKIEIINSFV